MSGGPGPAAAAMPSVAELVAGAGDVAFVDNLARLVDACRERGALNGTGVEVLRRVAGRHLRNLRELAAHVRAHPEVADRPLGAPIVVTGLPRTGTTLLHNLLALDPAHRALRLWEALRPVPPEAGGPPAEERRAQAQRWLDGFDALVPGFRAIHRSTPTGPEECDALLQNAFASQHFGDMFDAPGYSAWWAGAPLTREYAHYALQLRVLTRPGAAATWVLKSPGHLGHLGALRAALPGCAVVACHRDPRQVVGSYASLVHTLRQAYCERPSPETAGTHALAQVAAAAAAGLAARRVAGPDGFVDVAYASLVDDPVGAVRGIYAGLGRPLPVEVEARVRTWAAAHPRHAEGAHDYDLARFGLTGPAVETALAAYLGAFGTLASG